MAKMADIEIQIALSEEAQLLVKRLGNMTTKLERFRRMRIAAILIASAALLMSIGAIFLALS